MRGLLVGACVIVLLGCSGVVGPSPTRQGETWTHRELAEHLQSKGLQFKLVSGGRGGAYGTPATFDYGAGTAESSFCVNVLLMDTPQKARDHAGADPDGYAWGRFFFSGDRERVAEIRKALE